VKNTITDISNSIVDIKNSYPGYESKLKRLAITHRPIHQSLKMLGCFNPNVGKIWKNAIKNVQLKMKVEVGLHFEITFLTQHLGLSIFYPHLG